MQSIRRMNAQRESIEQLRLAPEVHGKPCEIDAENHRFVSQKQSNAFPPRNFTWATLRFDEDRLFMRRSQYGP
ncbi:hypothetical protein N7536_004307 [Penicillium majusculum]|nr:hypothetical protein N7536_004307 [Penicillium majusculum]